MSLTSPSMKGYEPVCRTFRCYRGAFEIVYDENGWPFELHPSGVRIYRWEDLLKQRFLVIVGERGLGKTAELDAQAKRITQAGGYAFFIRLSHLTSGEQRDLIFREFGPQFTRWQESGESAHFFLDSIDDTRVVDFDAFRRALSLFADAMRPYGERISIVLSSRIPDWDLPDVREVMEHYSARLVQGLSDPPLLPQVYRLEPLSVPDAQRIAAAEGVEVGPFWRALERDDYLFMATRPLDLKWLAAYWRLNGRLGSYTDLIEASMKQWLTEPNQRIAVANATPGSSQARDWVERFAAACTFSNRPFICLNGEAPRAVNAAHILPDQPVERERLLHSALFHEGGFGQVHFHHRFVREYLSACWVANRMRDGLTVRRALRLIVSRPFGEDVVARSRRDVLAWLASMSTPVLEVIMKSHPELIFSDGDPGRWGVDALTKALDAYIAKADTEPAAVRTLDAGALRRLARALPESVLIDRLERCSKAKGVTRLIALVSVIELHDAATVLLRMLASDRRGIANRREAILALRTLASPDMHCEIAEAVNAGRVTDPQMIAVALEICGTVHFTLGQLTQALRRAGHSWITHPDALGVLWERSVPIGGDVGETLKVLEALVAILHPFAARSTRDRQPSWLVQELPACLLRAVESLPSEAEEISAVIVEGLKLAVRLQERRAWQHPPGRKLCSALKRVPRVRRRLIGIFAREHPNALAVTYRQYEDAPLIELDGDDLEWLVAQAIDAQTGSAESRRWYELARTVALVRCSGASRRCALQALCEEREGVARRADIAATRAERAATLRLERARNRKWKTERAANDRKQSARRARLLARLDEIRSGRGDGIVLLDLIIRMAHLEEHSGEHSGEPQPALAEYFAMRDLGPAITAAVDEGLRQAWRFVKLVAPADFEDRAPPREAVVGAISLNHACSAGGLSAQSFSDSDAIRALRLMPWDLGKERGWAGEIARMKPHLIEEVLLPDFARELMSSDKRTYTRTIDAVLNADEALRRPLLEHALRWLEDGRISLRDRRYRVANALVELSEPPTARLRDVMLKELERDSDVRLLSDDNPDPQRRVHGSWPSTGARWLSLLACCDFPAAIEWLQQRMQTDPAPQAFLERAALASFGGDSWPARITGTEREVRALTWLYDQLGHIERGRRKHWRGSSVFGTPLLRTVDPLRHLHQRIPEILQNCRGRYAHAALLDLAARHASSPDEKVFAGRIVEQSLREAHAQDALSPEDVLRFGEMFARDPRTKQELFEQVRARLEEIQDALERGPDGEHELFGSRYPEKKFSRWLCARLQDTPRRKFTARFRAQRETRGRSERRIDIEVSGAPGSVGIENKLIDKRRSERSAHALSKTLENQLVRYLRDLNCAHGILVLVCLEERWWRIPDVSGKGSFADLIEYLQNYADEIRRKTPDISELHVLGIDCTQFSDAAVSDAGRPRALSVNAARAGATR